MEDKKINILCSTADPASKNIKEHLLEKGKWECMQDLPQDWEDLISVHQGNHHRIIEIKGHHIYQDRIDRKMERFGYNTDLIVVASKHKSKDGRPLLTAHFTGNPKDADFGGRPTELSVPSPGMLFSILRKLKQISKGTHYEVNMESTHHGPTDVDTPMVYAEIGSSHEQWTDPVAGDIVARAILEAEPVQVPVGIGFGGGHYASRQTGLILEADISFGHNFPDHALPYIDKNMLAEAFEISGADFVYFDRKSMNSKERQRLTGIIEELHYILLRESEIKEIKGLPWELFTEVKNICDKLCPDGRFRITSYFRQRLKGAYDNSHMTDGKGEHAGNLLCIYNICEELLNETIRADRQRTINMLEEHAPVFIEKKNGTISNQILGFADSTKTAMQNITNECIKILKEHYEIKYIPDENILYIISKRLDPKAAKDFGVPPGPMMGELAKGKPVVAKGKKIEPEMVYKRQVKEIRLS